MAGYDTGGGGGRVETITENSRITLSKPYDVASEWSPDTAQKINEMLQQLYEAAGKVEDEVEVIQAETTVSADVLKARVVLTDAQIQSLNTTPVTIVAAPGANKFIAVYGCWTYKNTSAGAYGTTPNFSLRFSGLATDLTTATSLFLASANNSWRRPALAMVGNSTDPMNLAIVATLTTDVTGGNAANYLVVEVLYTILSDNT